MTAGLCSAIGTALGPEIGVGACEFDAAEPIWPPEADRLGRAMPSRLREFAAGRSAARLAMQAIGAAPQPVPQGADRAPIWPDGMCGSIAHEGWPDGGGLALALAARRGAAFGLGIDLVRAAQVTPDLAPTIAFGREIGLPLAVVFAAKEAAFKAVYPLTHQIWEFDAIEIALRETGFVATLWQAAGPFAVGTALDGHLVQDGGLIVAALALPR